MGWMDLDRAVGMTEVGGPLARSRGEVAWSTCREAPNCLIGIFTTLEHLQTPLHYHEASTLYHPFYFFSTHSNTWICYQGPYPIMRALVSSLLLGAATAAFFPRQQVFQAPIAEKLSESWRKPLHNLKESLGSLSSDARSAWDEVSSIFPEQMSQASFLSHPKKHTRRPDSHWDHIIKGADVQSVWVENAKGEKEREVDGRLETYNLRSKKVDPAKLGVDPFVKQYSGYLDDEENDKHLFYCES